MSFALNDGRNPIRCLNLKSSTGRFLVVDIVKDRFSQGAGGSLAKPHVGCSGWESFDLAAVRVIWQIKSRKNLIKIDSFCFFIYPESERRLTGFPV